MKPLPQPLPLIDSHTHLDFDRFATDFAEVLQRARQAGLTRAITIGAGRGLAGSRRALDIANTHDWIFAAVGIHPHEASLASAEALAEVEALAQAHPKVVAIGETGLDYHYDRSPRDVQRSAFAAQIQVALRLRRPIIVHTREAETDTIDILTGERAADVGGVIHCFSSSAWLAERALDLGFYLSFSGLLTFPNAAEVQAVARSAPADRILVETDAPYLAPVPRRGERNEPAFVNYTARFLAQLRSVDPLLLAEQTSANAQRLFGV